MSGEIEPRPQGGLPFISDTTRQRMLEELNLDTDLKSQAIVAGITGERKPYSGELLEAMTIDTLASLADINRPFVQAVQEAIKTGLRFGHMRDHRDECAEGMAVVLRAFNMEESFDLLERFTNLQPEDIARVNQVIIENLGGEEI